MMIKKLLLTLLVFLLNLASFAQINTLPATESFTTTFTQGTTIAFIPNWTGSTVATTNKIFQDLVDYNSAPAALSIIPTSSFDGDVQVNLNLTSYQSIVISFLAKSMLNGTGTRDVVLTMSTSIDGGTTWIGSTSIASLPNANQSAFTLFSYSLPVEANNQSNVLVRFYVTRGATGTSTAAKLVLDDLIIQQSTAPQITLSQTALTFTQVNGVPSQSQSIIVSGSNLTGNVTLTAPNNYEISANSSTGFSNSVSLNPVSGNLLSIPVYVRLNSSTNGSFSGNLAVTSSGVSTQNVILNGNCVTPTVTNPNPLAIVDSSSYSVLSQWDNTNTTGTYPANMALWSHSTTDPDLNTLFVEDWNCLYNLTSRSRFVGEGINGISMINTSNSQFTGICDGSDPTQVTGTTIASGRAGALVLALNTYGVTNGSQITINWTGRTIIQNFRAYGLRMQYRIGTYSGNPNAGWQEFSSTQEYLSGADATSEAKTTILPTSCNGQNIVQIRWVYYYQGGTSTGARAQVALDDVSIVVGNLSTSDFNLNSNEFTLFPNPSNKEIVNLSSPQDIEIYDAEGKLIFDSKNVSKINTSSFQSGVYLIKSYTCGITKKLIVN